MDNKKRKKIIGVLVLSALALLSLAGCGSSAGVDLDDLYDANTTSAILETHDSIYDYYEYHENLDDKVTFITSYCYSEKSDSPAVFLASGYDSLNPSSEDNFNYCIVDNIEYMLDNTGYMTLYPLTTKYLSDFRAKPFTMDLLDAELLDSAKRSGDEITITTHADASQVYDEATLSSLNSLCGENITNIKKIYITEKDTLHIIKCKVYYVGESGEEYLFFEKSVQYDAIEPDVSFAEAYIHPETTRTVTVIERPSVGTEITNIYTLGAGISLNFELYTSNFGYMLYNDPEGLDPYSGDKADDSGAFPNITLYAMPANENLESVITTTDSAETTQTAQASTAEAAQTDGTEASGEAGDGTDTAAGDASAGAVSQP